MAITKDKKKHSPKINFKEQLTNAIIAAGQQWYSATKDIAGLSKKDYQVTVSFAITKASDGGIEFEIWGIGLSGKVDWEKAVAHTITLTFK